MVAYPDRGAGNDPIFFFFFFFLGGGVGGSLSPPRLNIFTVGNMGVMICLGQGGLRSLSASSFKLAMLPSDSTPLKTWLKIPYLSSLAVESPSYDEKYDFRQW